MHCNTVSHGAMSCSGLIKAEAPTHIMAAFYVTKLNLDLLITFIINRKAFLIGLQHVALQLPESSEALLEISMLTHSSARAGRENRCW